MRPAILDYGVGNLFSVRRAVEEIGGKVVITSSPKILEKATHLILPGVGAFPSAMKKLNDLELVDPIMEFARSGKPILGLCVGMQLLFEKSTEFEITNGLGLIPGVVKSFKENSNFKSGTKTPHIGWNNLTFPATNSTLQNVVFRHLKSDESFYFVHSFHASPSNEDDIVAVTEFGDIWFCSVVGRNNIVGLQFHPEKSGKAGLSIIQGFLDT